MDTPTSSNPDRPVTKSGIIERLAVMREDVTMFYLAIRLDDGCVRTLRLTDKFLDAPLVRIGDRVKYAVRSIEEGLSNDRELRSFEIIYPPLAQSDDSDPKEE